jgi:DNA-binding transcriptional LysR family regulator
MTVEWSRLRVLDAVARTGSVTNAAALLTMTGPAVSQQLRRIEAEAGARVVIPDGRGVRLTAKGQILARYARQVAEVMQQAENDLHRDEAQVDRLHIGVIATVIRSLLTSRLPAFQNKHPRVHVSVEDGETADHLGRLATGRLDLVLAESWSTSTLRLPAGVRAQQVKRERVSLALPAVHPLGQRQQLGIQDLADEPWTTCAHGSDAHSALTQAARRQGIELDVRYHVADHITQLALVRAGLAVACLPRPDNHSDVSGVVFRPLVPQMHRDILLLSGDRTPSLPLEALITHLCT